MLFKLAVVLSILTLAAGYSIHALVAFPLEVNASFPHIHFVLDIIAWLYFVKKRSKLWMELSFVAVVVQSTNLFWPVFLKSPVQFESGTELNILYSNVFVNNPDITKVRQLIEREKPDMVFLTEITEEWLEVLKLEELYPYSFLRPGKSADGNAIYSKFPLSETKRIPEKNYFAALFAKVQIAPNKEVFVNLVHAPAPQLDFRGDGRREFFSALNAEINSENRPNMIVIGDFNTSSSNHLLRQILEILKMRLSSNGRFEFPTWRLPELPFLVSPIDHLALGEDVVSDSFEVGPDVGSDHLPLLAKLRVR